MPSPIAIGGEAPNFDLSSTEDAVLMLKDEVIRTAIVLYFFGDAKEGASERVRRDLQALEEHRGALALLRARPLAISPLKVDDLKKLQAELELRFPLLTDDRNFAASYGVNPADPVLVVVSRRQKVLWLANPVASVAEALTQVEKLLASQPSPTRSYPKSVINRWIDRWVN
jgi:peroxiredoxin